MIKETIDNPDYLCWLGYQKIEDMSYLQLCKKWTGRVVVPAGYQKINEYEGQVEREALIMKSAIRELEKGLTSLTGTAPEIATDTVDLSGFILLSPVAELESGSINNMQTETIISEEEKEELEPEGFLIKKIEDKDRDYILISGKSVRGLLYGVFHFLRLLQTRKKITVLNILENPLNELRLVNHWDNLDGSIERGYAGRSIFFEDNQLTDDKKRWHDYARLLASVGLNGLVINNVNVDREASKLIDERLPMVEELASIFRNYGLQIYLSINFAAPSECGDLDTADPLAAEVREWWQTKAEKIYGRIPDFGGFLVKADSEHRPGPFTYGRTHAEGANMLAAALKPYGGLLIWRCFVYNCQQDWRDYKTDRARAAYDNFMPLDGEFADNVLLQIKNGPMDFQVREPVSPLLGAMEKTNQILELQITQEYTGQQIDLCYLIPQWKEILDFDTFARGEGSEIKKVVSGSLHQFDHSGIAGVVNVGRDVNWTGHSLAQANLYGFGRLVWDSDITTEEITDEWCKCTFGSQNSEVIKTVSEMLLSSGDIYEKYTAPLGVGWMVNPGHHYGPNVDGYEYSRWGTYHRADFHGIGVDRTQTSGTGYTEQYFPENEKKYELPESCPDELILFFHHLPYTYQLDSGKTIIQHIYDTHFEGVEDVKQLIKSWKNLEGKINQYCFSSVEERFKKQLENAREWRDVVNSYFYRKTGLPDEKKRKIYK